MLRLLPFSLINNLSRFQEDSICFRDEYRVSRFYITFYITYLVNESQSDRIHVLRIVRIIKLRRFWIIRSRSGLPSAEISCRPRSLRLSNKTRQSIVAQTQRHDMGVSHAIAITLSRRNLISLAHTFPRSFGFVRGIETGLSKGQRWRRKGAQKGRWFSRPIYRPSSSSAKFKRIAVDRVHVSEGAADTPKPPLADPLPLAPNPRFLSPARLSPNILIHYLSPSIKPPGAFVKPRNPPCHEKLFSPRPISGTILARRR